MFRSTPIIRWRRYNDRYLLEGNQCTSCNTIHYPKKALCKCGSQKLTSYVLKGKGKLVSYTEISAAPEKFAKRSPYSVGLIKLEEGPLIASQLTDATLTDLKVGLEVEAVFRKFYESGDEGAIHYGTKFRPLF